VICSNVLLQRTPPSTYLRAPSTHLRAPSTYPRAPSTYLRTPTSAAERAFPRTQRIQRRITTTPVGNRLCVSSSASRTGHPPTSPPPAQNAIDRFVSGCSDDSDVAEVQGCESSATSSDVPKPKQKRVNKKVRKKAKAEAAAAVLLPPPRLSPNG
jgi:hypothetical protein